MKKCYAFYFINKMRSIFSFTKNNDKIDLENEEDEVIDIVH